MSHAVAGSGRMRFAGGTETAVASFCQLSHPAGTLLFDTYAQAHWQESPLVHEGLLVPESGPIFDGRPYVGIRSYGTGLVTAQLRLEPGAIVGGPYPATATIEIRDGDATVASQLWTDDLFPPYSFFPRIEIIDGSFEVVAGHVYTAGIIMHNWPFISVYQSGTGGFGFEMSGLLTPPGEEPSFAMRGSGAVGTS